MDPKFPARSPNFSNAQQYPVDQHQQKKPTIPAHPSDSFAFEARDQASAGTALHCTAIAEERQSCVPTCSQLATHRPKIKSRTWNRSEVKWSGVSSSKEVRAGHSEHNQTAGNSPQAQTRTQTTGKIV